MKCRIKNQYGSTSIFAVIVMLLVGIIGAGMYNLSTTDLKITNDLRDGMRAQYLAEEGAQYVAMRSATDANFLGSLQGLKGKTDIISNPVIKETGSYKYRISWPSKETNPIMFVTGHVNNAYRTVVERIILPSGESVFDYGLFGGGGSIMINATDLQIEGSVRSNTRINIGPQATVDGDVISQYIDNKGTVTGTVQANSSALDTSSLATTYAYSPKGTLWANSQYDSNLKITANTVISPGTYHVEGDFTLDGKVELSANNGGQVIIYVGGNCNFEPDSKVKDGNYIIICNGTMNVKDKVEFEKAVLIAKNNITLGPDSKLTGSAVSIAGDINFNGKARVVYDGSFVHDMTGAGGSGGAGGSTLRFGSWSNKEAI